MTDLLTIKQAAKKLNISERTLYGWIDKQYISFVKLPGGGLRIKEENLERWIKKHEIKAA